MGFYAEVFNQLRSYTIQCRVTSLLGWDSTIGANPAPDRGCSFE